MTRALSLAVAAVLGFASAAQATLSISAVNTPITENFDTLSAAANTTGIAWTNDTTLPGWFLFGQPAPGNAITSYGTNTGSSATGNFYSFGTSGSTDRALGGIGSASTYFGGTAPASGAVAGWFAAGFTNNTGGTIDKVSVSFDGEQWRDAGNASGATQTMVVEYGIGASFGAVPTWTPAGAGFNFASPIHTTGPAAQLDGNNPLHRSAGLGGTISALGLTNGQTLFLRWIENNDVGSDHGLGIDNFSINAIAPALTTSPGNGGSLNFGNVRFGTTGVPALGITATNTGSDGGLNVTFPGATGDFSPAAPFNAPPLGAGDGASHFYFYTPSSRGADSEPLTITSNAGNSTITLQGTGVGPEYAGNPATDGAGGATEFAFGSAFIGSPVTLPFDITNISPDGDLGPLTDLTILSVSFNDPQFAAAGFVPGTVIGVGAPALSLLVQFTPGALGLQTALMTVVTDQGAALGAAGATFVYDLTGTGLGRPTAAVVPEPASALLLACAGIALLRRRR